MSDDGKEKLPTSKKLPTSEGTREENGDGKPQTVVVDYGGGIIVHHRLPDGSLDVGREFSDDELVPDEAVLDEDLHTSPDIEPNEGGESGKDELFVPHGAIPDDDERRIKTVDIDTLIAVKDILEADKKPVLSGAGDAEPRASAVSGECILHFSQAELDYFVARRKKGLAAKSLDWINRASQALWESTQGEISQRTLTAMRETVIDKYTSPYSHAKVLSFAVSFLKFQAKTKMEPRYTSFDVYLEMPKAVRERKSITERIVTKDDIENVLRHVKQAEKRGGISSERSAQYSAFVIFGAFTGQRSLATMAKLTVGQLREALQPEKPVLQVESSQDKTRMSHFVPLHPEVVKAVQAALGDRKNEEHAFAYHSFQMWVKRQEIPMSRFDGHFVLGDLRKFAEQHGDIIQWEHSNRAYVLTHGVSGVAWSYYKHTLPDSVYDIYMKYWAHVSFQV